MMWFKEQPTRLWCPTSIYKPSALEVRAKKAAAFESDGVAAQKLGSSEGSIAPKRRVSGITRRMYLCLFQRLAFESVA
jgi:hypothetical protein